MSHTIIDQCSGCSACKNVCPTHAIRGERKVIHVIDDTRCIDCGACGRICAFAAVLNQHNQLCEHIKRSEWQKPRFDLHLCTACGLCIQACPVSCLGLDQPQKGDKTCYPHLVIPWDCLGCSFCMEICPVDAVQMATLII
jgi:electron transport complex protein RnfB